jgi:hypothetical protein
MKGGDDGPTSRQDVDVDVDAVAQSIDSGNPFMLCEPFQQPYLFDRAHR